MNEQWQRLQRNVGNIFLQIVGKVLPYLNAVLMVLNEIAKIIAALFGFKLDDFDFFDESAIGGVADEFGEMGDNIGSAADNAKKLKQGLRGFDKLNVITTPSEGSSGGAGGISGGAGGINPKLMDAFSKAFDDYNKKLSEVQMKATRIRDKIMEWLGFTKYVDEETGEVKFKFEKITGGTILGALAVGGSIYKGINLILKLLNKIGLIKFKNIADIVKYFKEGKALIGLTKFTKGFEALATTLGISSGLLAGIVAAIVAVAGALIYAYNTSEDFRNSVNDLFKNIGNLFVEIYKAIEPAMGEIYELIVSAWENIKTTLEFIFGTIYDTIVFVFQDIIDYMANWAKVLTDLINGDYAKAFDDLKTMVTKLWENWNEYWGKIKDRFDRWVEDIMKSIGEFIPKALKKLNEFQDWLDKLPEKFGEAVGNAYKKFKEEIEGKDWKDLGMYIVNKVITGGIGGIPMKVVKLASELGTKIGEEIKKWDWSTIGEQILQGIINGMSGWSLHSKIAQWGNNFVQGIKNALGIHSPAQLIIDAKIGDYSFDAIMVGMQKQMPKLEEQAKDIVDSLNQGIKEASIENHFSYDEIPQFNASSFGIDQSILDANKNSNKPSINPTIIVQVGNKEVARQVITDLQDMAIDNGKPITIGG